MPLFLLSREPWSSVLSTGQDALGVLQENEAPSSQTVWGQLLSHWVNNPHTYCIPQTPLVQSSDAQGIMGITPVRFAEPDWVPVLN